jgi:hypothetical protein
VTGGNMGWVELDPAGVTGTVDVNVKLDFSGSGKTRDDLLADMLAAGLTAGPGLGSDWVTITTPAPTWGSPAFAWDLGDFDTAVTVRGISLGEMGYPVAGTVFIVK